MSPRGCLTSLAGPLLLLSTLSSDLHAQETLGDVPLESVESYITPEGEIVYYIRDPSIQAQTERTGEQLKHEFESAVRENIGMQEFVEENPDVYLAVGEGGIIYGMTGMEVQQRTFDAKRFALGQPLYEPAGLSQIVDVVLDPAAVLSTLADRLLEHATLLTCSMRVRPSSIEGGASVGGAISFSASWNVAELCE